MRTNVIVFAALAALVVACAESVPPGPGAASIEATGSANVFDGDHRVEILASVDVQSAVDGAPAAQGDVTFVLRGPQAMAFRATIDGLLRRGTVAGDTGGWVRMGAAVDDAVGPEASLRDDLLCLLVGPLAGAGFDVTKGDGDTVLTVRRDGAPERRMDVAADTHLPQEISRPVGDAGTVTLTAEGWRTWSERTSLRFPATLKLERPDEVRTYTVKSVVHRKPGEKTLSFDRPDDRAPGQMGPIERRSLKTSQVVAVEHRGPLTELAQVDLFLDRALVASMATRRGPNVRVFDRPVDEQGLATVTTFVPVGVSQDPGAGNLTRGAHVVVVKAHDVLFAPYVGPYPRDDSLRAALVAEAEKQGLVPDGPLRLVVMSDPDEGEPGDLRLELRLTVRERP